MKAIQLLRYVIPTGMCSVPTTLPQIPARPFWERRTDKGHVQLSLPPSILPRNHGPNPRPHPTAPLCAWVVAQPAYCLARLPGTYFMHKQTTQRRWPGGSDIKTTMSSQDHSPTPRTVNKGPQRGSGHLAP